jgi:hypothetical protein
LRPERTFITLERSTPTGLNEGLGASAVGEGFAEDCARTVEEAAAPARPASAATPFEKSRRFIFISVHLVVG